jgi:hypothetical protein
MGAGLIVPHVGGTQPRLRNRARQKRLGSRPRLRLAHVGHNQSCAAEQHHDDVNERPAVASIVFVHAAVL